MPGGRCPKKLFCGNPGGKRSGRPRTRWEEDVAEDLKRLGVRRWRSRALDRDRWKDFF